MESLAYIHTMIAYSEATPKVTLLQSFNWRRPPSSAWLQFVWVSILVAAIISVSEAAQAATVRIQTNSGNGVRVMQQPAVDAPSLGGIGEGDFVEVEPSATQGWLVITSGTYRGGYLDSRWASPVSGSVTPVQSANPSSAVPGSYQVQVKTDNGFGLNVRSSPEIKDGNIVGNLQEQEVVMVVASSNPGWLQITEGRLVGNYISNDWVVAIGNQGSPDSTVPMVASGTNPEKIYQVRTNSRTGLRVRALPTGNSAQIGGLEEGAQIKAKASGTPGWLIITDGNLRNGYIDSQWVAVVEPTPPAPKPSQPGQYQVRSVSGLNVRSSPNGTIIGSLANGEAIAAAPVSSQWLQIIGGRWNGGYVFRDFVAPMGTTNVAGQTSSYRVRTNSGVGVMVRDSPSTAGRILSGLPEGQVVTATAPVAGWQQISSGPAAGGYVSSNWLVPTGNFTAATNPSEGQYQVSTNSGVGLVVRSAPSTASKSLGGLAEGTPVVASPSGTPGWMVITTGPFAGGYVSGTWLTDGSTNASKPDIYRVSTNSGVGLVVRSAPSTASKSLGGLAEGTPVVASPSGTPGWMVITTGPFAGGYVSGTWLS